MIMSPETRAADPIQRGWFYHTDKLSLGSKRVIYTTGARTLEGKGIRGYNIERYMSLTGK